MSFNLDFKALAYASAAPSTSASPCSCALVFRCDDAARQATLLLVARTSAADTSIFVLQYDADAVLRGTASLTSANDLPPAQLQPLLRDSDNKHIDVKTLTFSVARPCPLWCAKARPDDPPDRSFLELAKATTIRIVFDYKHLRKQYHGMFKAFSKAARGLRGYPCEDSLMAQGLEKASWDVFAPVDSTGAPPAYARSRKRPRLASPNEPPSESSSTKHVPLQSPTEPAPSQSLLEHPSPAASHSSDKTTPFSPTTVEALERALKQASPEFDFQAEAISAAVRQHMPAHLERLQASAIKTAIDVQLPSLLERALHSDSITPFINAAVTTYLDIHLPSMIQSLLTAPAAPASTPNSPTPSSTSSLTALSTTSYDSAGNRYASLPPLPPLASTLLPHLSSHLTPLLPLYAARQMRRFKQAVTKTMDELETHAYDARAQERAELMDEIEDQSIGFALLKGDVIREVEDEMEQIVERVKEEGEELRDGLVGEMWDIYRDMKGSEGLARLIAREVRKCVKGGRRGSEMRIAAGKKTRRGAAQLLGRKREADDEWVDC